MKLCVLLLDLFFFIFLLLEHLLRELVDVVRQVEAVLRLHFASLLLKVIIGRFFLEDFSQGMILVAISHALIAELIFAV